MKIFVSYFYQVRFFKPYQIPVSTALYDPKWFNAFKGQGYRFIDKNGVINGIRAEMLKPGKSCEGLCHGKPCEQLPCFCDFLSEYEKQLFSLDKAELIDKFLSLAKKVQYILKFKEEPEIILLVHEAPDNECSERCILLKYFECTEWKRD